MFVYNPGMKFIYISPHLDDAALSCGGLIWEQSQTGAQVEIWTICAGDAPQEGLSPFAHSLHHRWESGVDAVAHRRAEDDASCALLGAVPRHFTVPDCIYRKHPETGEALYDSEQSLTGPMDPVEVDLVASLAKELAGLIPRDAVVIGPLAIGHHVDHQLTRRAFERLDLPLWYYADFPYSEHNTGVISTLLPEKVSAETFPVSGEGLRAWQNSVAAHSSQISTFWESEEAMQAAIRAYCRTIGGIRIWKCHP